MSYAMYMYDCVTVQFCNTHIAIYRSYVTKSYRVYLQVCSTICKWRSIWPNNIWMCGINVISVWNGYVVHKCSQSVPSHLFRWKCGLGTWLTSSNTLACVLVLACIVLIVTVSKSQSNVPKSRPPLSSFLLTRLRQAVVLINPLMARVSCKCYYFDWSHRLILRPSLRIANSQYSCVFESCTLVIMITVVGVLRYNHTEWKQ